MCSRRFVETIKQPRTRTGNTTVRATTLLNKLLNLPGIAVRGVSLPAEPGHPLVVDVALRRGA